MKLTKCFFALLMLVSVLAMPSCSDDDKDWGGDHPSAGDEADAKAGDDFYMFVNEGWHNTIGEVDVVEGFVYDAMDAADANTNAVLDEMDEVRIIRNSCKQLMDEGLAANLAYTDSIVQTYSARIELAETKEELGRILGECIAKGYADCMLKLFAAAPNNDSQVCYTLSPEPIKVATQQQEPTETKHRRHFNFGTYEKYSSKMSRSGEKDFMTSVTEGLGLDLDLFYVEKNLKGTYDNYNAASLEELKETILNSIQAELYVYCGDANTQMITNNAFSTTYDYLQKYLSNLLVYPLSYYYCEKYVDDAVKVEYTEHAETLREVFKKRIENNEWLSEPTRQQALNKLTSMRFFIGEPDTWYTETFPQLKGELFVEDVLTVKQSRNRTIITLLGKNKHEEAMAVCALAFDGMAPFIYNAGHYVEANAMLILPAFMMAPEYTSDMPIAQKYASLVVIGHEMTHAFDMLGCEYDANGNLNNWWEPADKEKFLALNQILANQISNFEIVPGLLTDGNRTKIEDVADLGGMNIAYDALNDYLKEQGISGNELLEVQRDFFKNYAYRYSVAYGEPMIPYVLDDVHSAGHIRVNGIVQHMNCWYDLFQVTADRKLYLPEENRVTIW
jgi:predicted metalloendopeptidase